MTASFAAVFLITVFIAFLRCKERVLRNAIGIGRFLFVISDLGQEERRKDPHIEATRSRHAAAGRRPAVADRLTAEEPPYGRSVLYSRSVSLFVVAAKAPLCPLTRPRAESYQAIE
jgi:hypothetical protein